MKDPRKMYLGMSAMEHPHEAIVWRPWVCENSRLVQAQWRIFQPDCLVRENRATELHEGPWEAKGSRDNSHKLKVSWKGARHSLNLYIRAPAGSGSV